MWPDARVIEFVGKNFMPARVHVRDDAADFKRFGERYGAQWTPTILLLDHEGTEGHRIEGFVDADEMLAQFALGLGHLAFKRNDWKEAEQRFREVVEMYAAGDVAAEALYWSGAARYKTTHDANDLTRTFHALSERYPTSTWAKKASVWKK